MKSIYAEKMVITWCFHGSFNSYKQKDYKEGSGVISVIDPWQVGSDKLTPISFAYRLS
jgi:hypothetical protein